MTEDVRHVVTRSDINDDYCVSQEEESFIRAGMDKVHSSYLRSLQELGDLLKRRAETLKTLKI